MSIKELFKVKNETKIKCNKPIALSKLLSIMPSERSVVISMNLDGGISQK